MVVPGARRAESLQLRLMDNVGDVTFTVSSNDTMDRALEQPGDLWPVFVPSLLGDLH